MPIPVAALLQPEAELRRAPASDKARPYAPFWDYVRMNVWL